MGQVSMYWKRKSYKQGKYENRASVKSQANRKCMWANFLFVFGVK